MIMWNNSFLYKLARDHLKKINIWLDSTIGGFVQLNVV